MPETIRKESFEPVVGHRVEMEVYEDTSNFGQELDELKESLGLEPADRRRIKITESDVDWENKHTVTMKPETFEKLCDWYQAE